jgi:hypothetical protein
VWILQLLSWLAQSARVLVWVAAALAAGLLGIHLLRLLRSYRRSAQPAHSATPTHIGDLDIRPESLPPDIGLAARKLWQDGAHRAALSLLYRGLLSRLVHVHNLPIRDSSTEGDCLRLAATRLQAERSRYVNRLIGTWQHAVYGGLEPDVSSLYVLCDEFGPAMDAA